MATCINTSDTGIFTTFGKFIKIVGPGLHFYIPFVQKIHKISNKTQQNNFEFSIMTKDKVFASLRLSTQYKIEPHDTSKAFFSLSDPKSQIESYVENSVRSYATKSTLTELFESFDEIGKLITESLHDKMYEHGYTLENILVTGIKPDKEVENAINRTSASERLKEAAKNEAEAEYTRKIREAEGERDKKILHGQGIAGQRQAIINGYQESVQDMVDHTGLLPLQILDFMLKTQELDTKEQIGKSSNAKVLFFESMDQNKSLIMGLEATK